MLAQPDKNAAAVIAAHALLQYIVKAPKLYVDALAGREVESLGVGSHGAPGDLGHEAAQVRFLDDIGRVTPAVRGGISSPEWALARKVPNQEARALKVARSLLAGRRGVTNGTDAM